MDHEAEAAVSGEQVELELETPTARDQSLPNAENSSQNPEEGKPSSDLWRSISDIVFFAAVDVGDNEKPPTYNSLGLAHNQLPPVQQKNSLIGKFCCETYSLIFCDRCLITRFIHALSLSWYSSS